MFTFIPFVPSPLTVASFHSQYTGVSSARQVASEKVTEACQPSRRRAKQPLVTPTFSFERPDHAQETNASIDEADANREQSAWKDERCFAPRTNATETSARCYASSDA